MNISITLRASLVLAASCAALAASAQSILSNLNGSYTPNSNTTLYAGTSKAVGLTTGASPLSLVSMSTLMAKSADVGGSETFSGGLYSDLGSAPGAQLAALSSATVISTTPAVFTLTPLAPYVLAPNTTYWFVLSSASNTLNLNWDGLNPNTAPTPTGVSFVGYRLTGNSGATWTTSGIFNGVNIQAQAVPEPSAIAALGLGAVALLKRRKRA